jgi:hypothetical protein
MRLWLLGSKSHEQRMELILVSVNDTKYFIVIPPPHVGGYDS